MRAEIRTPSAQNQQVVNDLHRERQKKRGRMINGGSTNDGGGNIINRGRSRSRSQNYTPPQNRTPSPGRRKRNTNQQQQPQRTVSFDTTKFKKSKFGGPLQQQQRHRQKQQPQQQQQQQQQQQKHNVPKQQQRARIFDLCSRSAIARGVDCHMPIQYITPSLPERLHIPPKAR